MAPPDRPPRAWTGLAGALALAGLALAYLAAGKAGLALASVHPSATPVWAPTGIAIAALLLGGLRLWPGVFAGAFFTNATTAGSVVSSLGIAAGNTLEALVAAWLVGRLARGPLAFERAQDVFKYAVLAGGLATTVSASVGVGSLVLTGFATQAQAPAVWTTWWLGDAAGALVVGPAIVTWFQAPRPRLDARAASEGLALAAGFALVGLGVAVGAWPAAFGVLPLVVGAAYRYGPRGASAASLSVSLLAVAALAAGIGPPAPGGFDPLLLSQVLTGVVAVTGLALGALAQERARTEAKLRQARDGLERAVAERTSSLTQAVEELRSREAQLNQAQGLAMLGSWEWDVARDRVRWSDELYRIYGLEPRGFAASFQAYLERVHPEDRARAEGVIRGALERGGDFEFEERIVRPGGEVRWLRSAGRVLRAPDGSPRRMVGVCHDITDLRRAEAERRAAFEQATENRRLQELDRLRRQFINSAAHELNTPLTPIKLQLALLEQAASAKQPLDQHRSVAILRRNVDRMALLVQDMLDVARLQDGRLRLARETVDLAAAAREAVETFEDLARERGVALEAGVPRGLRADADPARLAQVLMNLVSNALRFTPAGGRVAIEARRVPAGLEVRVRDTGAGLAPEQLAQLFQPFTQVHATGPGPQAGTGLGLFISRGIVEQHGGRLWAESDGPGKGSTFAFTLPEAPGGGRGRAALGAREGAGARDAAAAQGAGAQGAGAHKAGAAGAGADARGGPRRA